MSDFPIFKTKIAGVYGSFALDDPAERKRYFKAKAHAELEKIRAYLKSKTFIAFLIGPKNSGKGTCSKLFKEAVGNENIRHISVGDVVRDAHKILEGEAGRTELVDFLQKNYRGLLSIDEAVDAILGRSTQILVPNELILALIEYEIFKSSKTALFIDGFPRNMDQVSLALYFSALMGYRGDPDFFVFIDVPEAVIDERIKYRVVCPVCQTPRNKKLLRTKEIGFDEKTKEYYLVCDDPKCGRARMVSKEGDELGIEAIRDRIETDKAIMQTLQRLHGVQKVYLRNSIPTDLVKEYADHYEITPAYRYTGGKNKVRVIEEFWTVKDENGREVHSLLPAPVVLALIKEIVKVLQL